MDLEIINIDDLLHRTMQDRDFAKDVLIDYLEETPQMYITLLDALKSYNLESCIQISHKLKGSSASAGAIKIMALTKEIETLAKQSEIERLEKFIPDFKRCYNETIQTIKSLDIMK